MAMRLAVFLFALTLGCSADDTSSLLQASVRVCPEDTKDFDSVTCVLKGYDITMNGMKGAAEATTAALGTSPYGVSDGQAFATLQAKSSFVAQQHTQVSNTLKQLICPNLYDTQLRQLKLKREMVNILWKQSEPPTNARPIEQAFSIHPDKNVAALEDEVDLVMKPMTESMMDYVEMAHDIDFEFDKVGAILAEFKEGCRALADQLGHPNATNKDDFQTTMYNLHVSLNDFIDRLQGRHDTINENNRNWDKHKGVERPFTVAFRSFKDVFADMDNVKPELLQGIDEIANVLPGKIIGTAQSMLKMVDQLVANNPDFVLPDSSRPIQQTGQ